MDWILACDIGTTTLKLGAVAPDGRVLGLVRHEYDLDTPGPDMVELGPDVYWTFYREGLAHLLEEPQVRAVDLRGVGFSSQATTFLCRDARDEPLGPFIVWLDARAGREADEINAQFDTAETFPRYGQLGSSGLLAVAKLLWLGRHRPDVLAATKRIFWAEDDLIFRLTGEHATDAVLAGATGLYDMRAGRWWPEMLDFVGVGEEQLPRVVPCGQAVGTLSASVAAEFGLPAGVPVAAGTNDQLAGAISVGNIEPGIFSETTGTALALVATVMGQPEDPSFGVPYWGHPAPGRFSILVYTNTATIVLKWFREQFCADMDYEAIMAEVAKVPVGSEGVVFFPHFIGTGSPDNTPGTRGEIAGLGLQHTRFHVARALVESLTFSLKDLVDTACRVADLPEVIRSLGGGARSDLWLQMKSDLLGVPIEKPDCDEPALLGAGMLGALGAGLFGSFEEATGAMARPSRRFEPDPAKQGDLVTAYQRYRKLYERICQDARR